MKEKNSRKFMERGDILRLSAAAGAALVTGLLKVIFENCADRLFPGYRHFSRFMMKVLAAVTSVVPFAVWALIIALIALSAAAGLVIIIVKKRSFSGWFTRLLLTVTVLFCFETVIWNFNHYGARLADEMDLEIGQYAAEDLEEALAYYYDRAAEEAVLVEREEDGSLVQRPIRELLRQAGTVYTPLEEEYEVFSGGSKAPVKYLTVGSLLLPYLGISGEFAGFTGEASVPLGRDTVNQPFSMSHEAAHRLGIASEEDANFAAFLATTASEDHLFRYSGYYTAFVYLYNALYEADPDRLRSLMDERRPDYGHYLVTLDCDAASEYYAQYDSPLEEVSDAVTDTALKAFDEEAGIESYSLVVNELIAWYCKTGGAE